MYAIIVETADARSWGARYRAGKMRNDEGPSDTEELSKHLSVRIIEKKQCAQTKHSSVTATMVAPFGLRAESFLILLFRSIGWAVDKNIFY